MLISVVVLGVFAVGPAAATGYQGDVDYWSKFSVTINNNTVTGLQGTSGGVPCGDGVQIDPVTFKLAAPVPVTNGKFQAAGETTDDYNDTVQWSLSASVSVTRTISGSVTVTGPEPATHATTCSRTFPVAAIIPPRNLSPKLTTNFVDATSPTANPVAPAVYFDYRHGVITHLSANAGTECSQSEFPARLYTPAYRLDPIQVNDGRFKVVADVLDDYGVVTHVIVSGRIKGKVARGTISSSRYWDVNGTREHCTRHLNWVARSSHAVTATGGAFYDVQPYRHLESGGWRYYFAVEPHNCINRVFAVRFTIVGGPSRTVACNSIRKVGPLRPKRNYRIIVTGLRVGRNKVISKVPLGTLSAYLPGDDADWTPAPPIP
jgi:hypothetical protein